jgi:hypothetical protein
MHRGGASLNQTSGGAPRDSMYQQIDEILGVWRQPAFHDFLRHPVESNSCLRVLAA